MLKVWQLFDIFLVEILHITVRKGWIRKSVKLGHWIVFGSFVLKCFTKKICKTKETKNIDLGNMKMYQKCSHTILHNIYKVMAFI